jgi:hypothetical protein
MEEKPITKETPPRAIERDIATTRDEMNRTITEIEEKFSIVHWKALAKEILSDKTKIATARGRELAKKAGESASRIGASVQDNISKAKSRGVQIMNDNPEAVLVIAFELGVLLVTGWQAVQRRRLLLKPETGPAISKQEETPALEEAEQKIKEAVMPREKSGEAA